VIVDARDAEDIAGRPDLVDAGDDHGASAIDRGEEQRRELVEALDLRWQRGALDRDETSHDPGAEQRGDFVRIYVHQQARHGPDGG